MNRRFVRSLLLAALLVLLCTQVFAAQETLAALRLDPEPGFTTRMKDTDGNTLTQSGVLNPDGLANSVRSAKIASYSIYYNGRLLMTVTPVGFSEPDAAVMSGGAPTCTGFYKTTFSIDDTREIFLTGLTESTLEQVQTELTASALEDRYFSLTNVDFIDAEKEFTDVAEGEIASDAIFTLSIAFCSKSIQKRVRYLFPAGTLPPSFWLSCKRKKTLIFISLSLS